MTEFNFDTINKEGIKYYVIPEGTMLYHGSDRVEEINGIPDFQERLHTFFALSQEYAAKYAKRTGNVYKFRTLNSIELVALDKSNEVLYDKVSLEMKNILDDNYGFHNNHKRMSEPKNDNALSQYLCEKGFNGYAAGDMDGVDLTYDLDPEIVLCNINSLEYIGRINVGSHDGAPRLQDKRRKTRRIYDSPEKKPSGMGLFGNDDDDDNKFSSSFTGNLDFGGYETPGGKKKKTTKRNKPKKASKKKQTKKGYTKKQTKKRRAKK